MDERRHTAPEHFLRARAPEIELVVLDVDRSIRKRSIVEPDHAAAAVQVPREAASEPAADPGDDNRAFVALARRAVQ